MNKAPDMNRLEQKQGGEADEEGDENEIGSGLMLIQAFLIRQRAHIVQKRKG